MVALRRLESRAQEGLSRRAHPGREDGLRAPNRNTTRGSVERGAESAQEYFWLGRSLLRLRVLGSGGGESSSRCGSLEEVDGLRFVFYPQSADGDDLQAIQDRLRAIDWKVPFSFRLLNDNYTRALLGAKPDVPMALLLTPEGRVLHRAELGARGAISAFRSVARS